MSSKKKLKKVGLAMRITMAQKEPNTLSLTKQCKLLSIGRTSIYYTPQTSSINKLFMDSIYELFTEDPARGTRRLRAALKRRFNLQVAQVRYVA